MGTKRRTRPVKVLPPTTAPMSNEDYDQAVSTLVSMIASWWYGQNSGARSKVHLTDT